MSTLIPRPPYSDAELAVLYPSNLRLQQVQILLRHGERTPVKPRFANTGLPTLWPYCSAARQLRSVVLDGDGDGFSVLEWKRRLETLQGHTASGPRGEVDDICDHGMLTDRGRLTTLQLGQRLRALYIDRLAFLPPTMDTSSSSLLYLRSTAVPRALESLQQTFHGLYPPQTRAADFSPTIVSRPPPDETLLPNFTFCPRFAALSHAYARRASDRWNSSPDMDHISSKLSRYMPSQARVGVDSHPRLSGIMDTINATAAHGADTRLPRDFYDVRARRAIDRIVVEEWYAPFDENEEYRTLGIGALLHDVVTRMVHCVEAAPAPRLALAGCHDTTLAAILASLGSYPGLAWPPFTSHVALELFTTPSHKPADRLTGSFVRLRYNDRPVTIPGCARPGNHLEGDTSFCTLEAFKSIVDRFTPQDWKAQCSVDPLAPAFPEKPQPAGY